MAIKVDCNEPEEYRAALAQLTDVVTQHLSVGDYSWTTDNGIRVAVERKRVRDLLDSFKDNRWQRQIPRLAESDVPILLIEGDWRTENGFISEGGRWRGWSVQDVEERLLVAQTLGVLRVHVPSGPIAVARRIRGMFQETSTETLRTLVPQHRIRAISPDEVVGMGMLMTLPYIGEVTARSLIEGHGSMANVFAAIQQGRPCVGKTHHIKEWQRMLGYATEEVRV